MRYLLVTLLLNFIVYVVPFALFSYRCRKGRVYAEIEPKSPLEDSKAILPLMGSAALAFLASGSVVGAAEDNVAVVEEKFAPKSTMPVLSSTDYRKLRVPYNRENVELGRFLGKATIVFNMKLDDPQTMSQYPTLVEISNKYKGEGLNVLCFPSEQGYFEPDDDETCRAKSKEYYFFGDYPRAVVFDKVDFLGPSASPLFSALTKDLPTPNGYSRITLNYEKFLLDATGHPVRRYPRKFSAYDMEADIQALLSGKSLPEESPAFHKAWREAKREAVKSEYAFRFNYNYYNSPDSMYKYDAGKDAV